MNQHSEPIRAYKINLSKGNAIPIDPEEIQSVLESIKTGMPCRVKQGVFNPSYYVSITEDKERIDEIQHHNSTAYENNQRVEKYGGTYIEYKGLQPLKDIFEGVNLHTQPALKKGDNSIPKIGQM